MPETVPVAPVVPVPEKPPVPEHNPYAPYGLDAQGNPLTVKQVESKPDPMAEKIAGLESTIASMGEQLKATDSMKKQMAVIDKVVKAVSGDSDAVGDPKQYKAIFDDLKRISPPGVRKLLELLENDPEGVDRMTNSVQDLRMNQLVGINVQAHNRVLELASKAGFKAGNDADMNKMVFPFERAITEVINANPKLADAFKAGNVDVIDEVFNSLVSPHIAQRLREKQTRTQRANVTKTPPFGKAQPQATSDSKSENKPDIRTPKGRAEFHKQASARFFDKIASRDEE